MPQHGHKKPFSTKQKKKQLQLKREKKKNRGENDWGGRRQCSRDGSPSQYSDQSTDDNKEDKNQLELPQMSQKKEKGYDPNRYKLHFQKETKEELDKSKREASIPHDMVPENMLEIDIDDVYKPGTVLDIPKRPHWDYNMSKDKLLAREEKYFREYLENILKKFSIEELSYLELNLETWRQLWRVLEMGDIILLITDIRHPALHFSPALYDYVTKELRKPLILVLNKVDMVSPALVTAWRHFFQEKYPGLQIILFTSFPRDALSGDDPAKVLKKVRRKKKNFVPVGPMELFETCESIVQGKVDLTNWKQKIEEDLINFGACSTAEFEYHVEDLDSSFSKHDQYKDGILTLGCCGYPNVGKSSLINGLVGKKVVSVSRTPGHTKHFQTIFLTKTVKLCDCPGLVFPSVIPKPMQILAGIYPIAQVREPYSAIGYLSQRLEIQKILQLKHPDAPEHSSDPVTRQWSAYDICEAWAVKRGYFTARASRPDLYRAANSLLRLAVEGRLCFGLRPPNFTAQKADWELHPETQEISRLQQQHNITDGEQNSQEEEEYFDSQESEIDECEHDEENEDNSPVKSACSNPFALLADDD